MSNQNFYNNNQQNLSGQNNMSMDKLPTEIRRKYPKDVKDRKNEWEAIEFHKQDINQQLQAAEQDIKNLRQKELLSELDRKMIEMLEQKQTLLMQKHQDALKMQQEREIYLQQEQQQKQDKKAIGMMMQNYYTQQQQEAQRKLQENKQQKIEWEQKLLEYNREKLESEEKRQRNHKQFMTQERLNDIQRAQIKKEQENLYKQKTDLEYRQLMQLNAERELTKEENYKNFYKLASLNQNQRHNQHYEKVLKPQLNKDYRINEIIDKNYDQELKRREQDELERMVNRKQNSEIMRDQNMGQIRSHMTQKEIDELEKKQKVQERISDLQKYQEYLEQQKQEKLKNQNQYKGYLDVQKDEKEKIQNNMLRMTKAEKQLNKHDLQAYKGFDNGMYSMLPGWQPQIGQLPPNQNREKIQNQIQNTIRNQTQHKSTTNLNDGWQEKYQQKLALEEKMRSIYEKQNAKNGQFQKIGEPIEKFNVSAVYGDARSNRTSSQPFINNQSAVLGYGHNPLTNPVPYNIQNPYIAKEFQKAQAQKSMFQNAGNSTLN